MKKKISILAACYNEEKNIKNLYHRVTATMATLPAYDYELLYIDNASVDKSLPIFKEIIEHDPRIKTIIMSRNFGSNQPSILAGMHQATGDCIIILAGDLQDPPELIPQFVHLWQTGYDIVYGIAKKRKGNILRRIGYTCFYRLFKMLSYLDIPLDSGDFSLIDKKAFSIIKQLPEKDLYLRGLRTWVGFKQIGLEYQRDNRTAGKTSNSFFANFMWAKKAIVNFSYKPLEYISTLAMFAVFVTCFTAGLYLYWYFKYGAPQGFLTILMIMFIFGTLQLLALSIIGEYLIKIFEEVKGRPPFVIKEIIDQSTLSSQQQPDILPLPTDIKKESLSKL